MDPKNNLQETERIKQGNFWDNFIPLLPDGLATSILLFAFLFLIDWVQPNIRDNIMSLLYYTLILSVIHFFIHFFQTQEKLASKGLLQANELGFRKNDSQIILLLTIIITYASLALVFSLNNRYYLSLAIALYLVITHCFSPVFIILYKKRTINLNIFFEILVNSIIFFIVICSYTAFIINVHLTIFSEQGLGEVIFGPFFLIFYVLLTCIILIFIDSVFLNNLKRSLNREVFSFKNYIKIIIAMVIILIVSITNVVHTKIADDQRRMEYQKYKPQTINKNMNYRPGYSTSSNTTNNQIPSTQSEPYPDITLYPNAPIGFYAYDIDGKCCAYKGGCRQSGCGNFCTQIVSENYCVKPSPTPL